MLVAESCDANVEHTAQQIHLNDLKMVTDLPILQKM